MKNLISSFAFAGFCLVAMALSSCNEQAEIPPQVYQSGQGEYIVIYSYSSTDLSTGVGWRLAEGYVCQGGVSVRARTPYSPDTIYFQAMIKKP